MSETWLNKSDDLNVYRLEGYHAPVTLDRPNEAGGGGVLLYVHEKYNFKFRNDLSHTLTWGSNYQTKLKPIHILQKRAIRAILFADNRTPSKPLFSKLQILTIYEITRMQQAEFMYKRLNNLLPETIFE